jgi:hypothetical protein
MNIKKSNLLVVGLDDASEIYIFDSSTEYEGPINSPLSPQKYNLSTEIKKAYTRGYRAAEQKNNSFKVGRRRGVIEVKRDIRGFITGTRSCKWLPDLLQELGYELTEIKDKK